MYLLGSFGRNQLARPQSQGIISDTIAHGICCHNVHNYGSPCSWNNKDVLSPNIGKITFTQELKTGMVGTLVYCSFTRWPSYWIQSCSAAHLPKGCTHIGASEGHFTKRVFQVSMVACQDSSRWSGWCRLTRETIE